MVDPRQAFEGISQIEVQSALPGWVRLHLAPSKELRDLVIGFVHEEVSDLPGDLCEQLTLAVDELLGNSMEHGCRLDPTCDIEFTFIRTERMILFHIRDTGPGFSMNNITHAAVNNPPEEPLRHTQYRTERGMRPGGFGIMLVKKIADELLYSEQGNEVVLVKYLGNGASPHS